MRYPLGGRAVAVVLIGVAAASILAGCSGGSSTNSAPDPTPTASAAGNGIQAYISCLTQHGVTLPSRAPRANGSRGPGAGPSFTRGPRPSRSPGTGGFGGGGGFGRGGGFGGIFGNPTSPPAGVSQTTWTAALTACKSLQPTATGNGAFNNSQFTAYRNCLQSHGVTFSAGPGGFSTNDPKVAAALKTCAPLRPSTPPRGGAPTPTPSASG